MKLYDCGCEWVKAETETGEGYILVEMCAKCRAQHERDAEELQNILKKFEKDAKIAVKLREMAERELAKEGGKNG